MVKYVFSLESVGVSGSLEEIYEIDDDDLKNLGKEEKDKVITEHLCDWALSTQGLSCYYREATEEDVYQLD